MTSLRSCPQCGHLVEGRADKLFCSTACRAQHFRDQAARAALAVDEEEDEEADEGAPPPEIASAPPRPAAQPPGSPEHPWPAGSPQFVSTLIAESIREGMQKAEQAAAQRARQDLLERYERGVQTWLQLADQPLADRAVSRYLREVDQLTAHYRAHPAINQAAHPAQLRLQVLYKVGDALRALQGELAEQAASFTLWERAKPTAALEFSKKRRQQLRDSLLGDA